MEVKNDMQEKVNNRSEEIIPVLFSVRVLQPTQPTRSYIKSRYDVYTLHTHKNIKITSLCHMLFTKSSRGH